jgi:hypothetical protein
MQHRKYRCRLTGEMTRVKCSIIYLVTITERKKENVTVIISEELLTQNTLHYINLKIPTPEARSIN